MSLLKLIKLKQNMLESMGEYSIQNHQAQDFNPMDHADDLILWGTIKPDFMTDL